MKNKSLWTDDAYVYASSEGSQAGWFVLMAIGFLVIAYMAIR